MKKFFYFIAIYFAVTSFSTSYGIDKIAIVNTVKIFQQAPQQIEVAKKIESEFKNRAEELRIMENDLQKKIQKLQRNTSTMTKIERDALEKLILEQRENFSNKLQKFEEEHSKRQDEERKKILSLIQKIINSVAKEKGYDLVIDSNAISYSNNTIDITSDVLKQVK